MVHLWKWPSGTAALALFYLSLCVGLLSLCILQGGKGHTPVIYSLGSHLGTGLLKISYHAFLGLIIAFGSTTWISVPCLDGKNTSFKNRLFVSCRLKAPLSSSLVCFDWSNALCLCLQIHPSRGVVNIVGSRKVRLLHLSPSHRTICPSHYFMGVKFKLFHALIEGRSH